ncbi:lytic transglycosylase domain-containing protein [Spirosoma montaniterrae]|uniref:Lytic murein transglycosylase n=1 Tax=Spirosoma montaniterrae TaxID=1178516 RepID=A0A1P9X0B3_9BACT|nr:lytic transglycosylase domain-containing protein [Spirosoma montaniterrae]AQG81038.1 lytic murein transglycosylase [Spirosoma montaniterrae]
MRQRIVFLAGVSCLFVGQTVAPAQPTPELLALNTPAPVHFCGESLPTDQPAITERWTRTLNRQATAASSLAVLKRRAAVVFPLIEPILKQYHIPADFKFLPLLESAVTNNAVSRRGAAGFWQLMPHTAQSLGLSVSRGHDERFNLHKATQAACRYIRSLYEQLGSWMLVASAYNAGPGYISQLVRRHPNRHPMALPYRAAETKAYLYQAVAIKELITRPQAYHNLLNKRQVISLSDDDNAVPVAERAAILASFDVNETNAVDVGHPAFVADSTTAVVLLTEDEAEETEPVLLTDSVETAPVAQAPASAGGSTSNASVALPDNRLFTRCLSNGPLTEGQLCLFQVVQPLTLNGRVFAVGDVVQAYVDVIDTASGRVFLRAIRLTIAQTQETAPLRFVATGQPRRPGVPLPTQVEGWGTWWEEM